MARLKKIREIKKRKPRDSTKPQTKTLDMSVRCATWDRDGNIHIDDERLERHVFVDDTKTENIRPNRRYRLEYDEFSNGLRRLKKIYQIPPLPTPPKPKPVVKTIDTKICGFEHGVNKTYNPPIPTVKINDGEREWCFDNPRNLLNSVSFGKKYRLEFEEGKHKLTLKEVSEI